MELTDDLVAIQGILISVIKTTGEFTKINYRGGNEEKILKIMSQIQNHISSKNYIKDGKINSIVDKQVENIVLFLALNTKYKKPLQLEEYDHLIDIMPQLSKCVLANVVYGLDLCKYYCKVIEKLPIKYGIELLDEIVPCLKKSVPDIQLRYATMLLRAAAIKLSSDEISEKDEHDIFKISEVSNVILQLLTGLYLVQVKKLKASQIYQSMGYSLLSLFELLLYCNKENVNLKTFIEHVLGTACIILKNVTINVYCSWAEVDEGDEPLQSLVASKAYHIVEEYQKYKEAKELISMLGAIAKKPKTLSERIQAADVTTIIKKVYVKDQDQMAWFKALLGTPVFDNKEAMRCVHACAHICDKDDVARLLKLAQQSENDEAKQLVIKCASTLPPQELITIMTRYFYEFKFKGLAKDTENVECRLKSIFNKTTSRTDLDEDFVKDMCLLMLQSPSVVLKGVYGECVKNKCYVDCYEGLFVSLKDIVNVNDFGVDVLTQILTCNPPDADNVDNYTALLSKLREIDYLSGSKIINGLLLPLLDQFRFEKGFQQLGYVLQIFLGCSINIPATSEMTKVRWALLNTMDDCRCTFLELDLVKQQTASYAVDVIKNLCEVRRDYNFEDESHTSSTTTNCLYDQFTDYYKSYLLSKVDSNLLKRLYSDFSTENYAECVSRVLEFLPSAVGSEWSAIIREMFFQCGSAKATELLTDVMILLCKVVHTQDADSNIGKQVVVALKYCLQQYGNALQDVQTGSTVTVEADIAKGVCRLLKHLPDAVKEQEGLSVINVLTQRSLRSLADDKEFACLLISINNDFICRTVAQRMVD